MHLGDPDHRAVTDSTYVPPATEPGTQSSTILLVEDEAFVRKVAGEILCSAGYRVLLARNAAEAVLAFGSHPGAVQLLLIDVVLPDRNGCDLALDLATLDRGFKTVFISGYPENSLTRRGVLYPEWSYLPKPFSAATLLQKIGRALNQASV